MSKLLAILAAFLIGSTWCMAAPEILPVMTITCANTATSVTNDVLPTKAYVYALKVAITPTTSTATVSVASLNTGVTIYSKSTTGAATMVFPVSAVCDNAGTALSAYTRYALSQDQLKLTVTSATTGSVTVSVTPIIERAP